MKERSVAVRRTFSRNQKEGCLLYFSYKSDPFVPPSPASHFCIFNQTGLFFEISCCYLCTAVGVFFADSSRPFDVASSPACCLHLSSSNESAIFPRRLTSRTEESSSKLEENQSYPVSPRLSFISISQPTVKSCSSRSGTGSTGRSNISSSFSVGLQRSHTDCRVCARASGVCRCPIGSSATKSNITVIGCGSEIIWRRGLSETYFMHQQSSFFESFTHSRIDVGFTSILSCRNFLFFYSLELLPLNRTVASPQILDNG